MVSRDKSENHDDLPTDVSRRGLKAARAIQYSVVPLGLGGAVLGVLGLSLLIVVFSIMGSLILYALGSILEVQIISLWEAHKDRQASAADRMGS
ncbi:hypothetical protein [Haloglycomyces albus]|uniref:hypothetical protein n=1 Tax=Haloglycomyces albus TaxID=526067 RepID=UPI00046D40C7|nr:hypothetical protein [Haloglycomyces albus]